MRSTQTTPDAPAKQAAPAAPAAASTPDLDGYPLARLRVPQNPIEALDLPVPSDRLAALGARSYQAFTATSPRVWLLVFEFADQRALEAALPRLDEILGAGDVPPYYRRPVYTGAWLLLTGFPGHKPVSPEMERARMAFVQAWAGEE